MDEDPDGLEVGPEVVVDEDGDVEAPEVVGAEAVCRDEGLTLSSNALLWPIAASS